MHAHLSFFMKDNDVIFNRAMLMNIGFTEANRDGSRDWQCFAMHDVDMYMEDDRNVYACPIMPRHLTVAIDKFQYRHVLTLTFYILVLISKM